MIHMQMDSKIIDKISFLTGDRERFERVEYVKARVPFDQDICDFLDGLSKELLHYPEAKRYPDIVTFAFFIRKAALNQHRAAVCTDDDKYICGRGISFHIAPSNVAINFAYSMCMALMMGNVCIVRVPSKSFDQTKIIVQCINSLLDDHPQMKDYLYLIRYDRDKSINDMLSAAADVRIIWGGDNTIGELRNSPLKPRGAEICFADRYSLAVIDTAALAEGDDMSELARAFYNDTYFSDQNACTSPRLIMWMGEDREAVKERFWSVLRRIAEEKYEFRDIQGVNKLTSSMLALEALDDAYLVKEKDFLITRISVKKIEKRLAEYFGNSGFFFEYDGEDPEELFDICDDLRCQTISYAGDKKMFDRLLNRHPKGVDRIVRMGHSMDFGLVWDGYDLAERLTRKIVIN